MSDEPDLHRSRRRRPEPEDGISRLPPHSLECEEALIGCCFLEPKTCIPEAQARIPSSDVFYDLRTRTLFEVIVDMYDDGFAVDSVTVSSRLKAFGQLESVGGGAYLSGLPDGVPSAANVGFYITTVLEKYQLRRMIQVASEAISRAYEHEGEVAATLDAFEAEAMKVRVHDGQTVSATCKRDVIAVMAQMQHSHERPNQLLGMSTGFPELDSLCDGFQNGDMCVIAGLTSAGKTALALGFCEHAAVDLRKPCGIFSLEMRKHRLLARIISARAGVSMKAVRRGEVDAEGISKLTVAARHVASAPIYIDDEPNLTITQIRARARRMHQQFGIALFAIDYLQLLETVRRKGDTREQEVAEVSKGIKSIARELNVPVLALAQLNRDFERDKVRKPRLADLRESARIGQDCDLCLMLYALPTKDEDAHKDEVPVNLFIAKQRDGSAGVDVHLQFKKSTTKYTPAGRIDAADLPVQKAPEPYADK